MTALVNDFFKTELDYKAEQDRKMIASKFSFHTPDKKGIEDMETIRAKCRELATLIAEMAPDGMEKLQAIASLQTVMMMANSAIVQQYPIKE